MYTVKIDDFKNWNDINKCIRHEYHNLAQNEFIILSKVNNQYILLSDDDVKNMNTDLCNCYLLPWYCLENISFHIKEYHKGGFNSYPKYEILKDLFIHRNDQNIYKLLWFSNVLYHIVKNNLYSDFEECLNYDETLLQNTFKHLLNICNREIQDKLGFEHKYIYKQTRKNFSPIDMIWYKYEYINKCLDISDVNVIIDYISLLIQQIKSEYRFIVVYQKLDKRIAEMLKNM